ncbi:hypothetical protein RND59_20145 [Vibrio ruber]|uniref:hypothetical protein n=1 Tax=Vibrio ruber TaxID=184755 RepID=UPI002893257C|nr:hypothetical protein [Vibrio ruber]WNJ97511.1 hypothetical protein RND59_20145 [Vibrio ruber]
MGSSIMRSFRKMKIISFLVFSMVVIYAIYVIASSDSFKKITNSENIEWLIIGNSHAYKILMNRDNVYYLNEDGADIERRMKQVEIGLSEFKNAKYFIINVTPLELYKPYNMSADDNEYLYLNNPLDIVDFFEHKLVKTPLSILEDSSNNDYFLPNGRKVSHGIHSRGGGDWFRESHFQGNKPDANYYIGSKNKLIKIIRLLKQEKDHRVILISMPLNHLYINYIKSYLSKYDVPDLKTFTRDMSHLGADCYISLYDYSLPTRMFWNGDHLNESGSAAIKSVLNNKINDCISSHK